MLIVPFRPILQVAPQVSTPQVSTPEDVRMDLEKFLVNRSIDGPLDSILTAYKENGIVPANVATNEDGAMGVLITIKNTADIYGLDDVVDVNWKVDFGVATIASAYVGSVDEVLALENYDGVVTAFADGLIKEKTTGVETRPIYEQVPITTEPAAYATTVEIGADLVVGDGIDGSGVRVGVIDSGIDFSHPDLVDAIDFGSDGLPTSYDPTGYGMGITLYRVNLTTVNPSAWMAYSSWNVLSFTEDGKTYIDTSTYQHNGGSPYLNNQGDLYDLDFFVDGYLDAWWSNAYPNQANLTDYYYNVLRQPQEIPDPATIAGGDQVNVTLNYLTGEWQMVPYACHGYVFQQRWEPYMKIFSNVLVVNSTKIIVDWDTTRAWTDFWNLNIDLGFYDFNESSTWDYYNAMGDWSFADDLAAGEYYTPDGTIAHTNLYHDYPSDGARFGLGLLAHVWDSSAFELGMIDGMAIDGRILGIMYDGDSHGTFVSGQIASRGLTQYPIGLNESLEYLPGVAPNSTVMSVMTIGITSEFNSMLWAAGFDFNDGTGYWEWNITSNHQMDITSNSWGWVTPQYYELRGQYSLIYAAMATPGFFDPQYPGMIQCFSAGNSGPGYGTRTPPIAPQLINVGASTSYHTMENLYGPDQGFDQIADFSSRGPLTLGYSKPDVLAPGRNSWGLVPFYGSAIGIPGSSPSYAIYSGTSIACPMVAGVAALLVEAYLDSNGVKARPDMIKTIIQSTADNIGMDGLSQGHGIVNAWAAYDYIVNDTGSVFYTYDSTENWATATAEAWNSEMNPYDSDIYIETASPPTDFADGNLYFGLVEGGDLVTMTIEGDYGSYSNWTWGAQEFVEDTITTFQFETYIYNETTSTGYDTTRAGWFELPIELGGAYLNFANATFATIFITGDQSNFDDDSLWASIFDWEDTDPANGWPDYYNMTTGEGDELTRIQYAGGTGNVLKMDLSHPDGIGNLFPNLGIICVHDSSTWNWPYTNGNNLEVTVVTWQLDENTVDFVLADNGSGNCEVTLTVPAMDSYGIHQGFINITGVGGEYKLPYTYNVYATYDTESSFLTLADGVSGSLNPYEPGVISAGCDSYYTDRSAVHHSFVVNMTNATVKYLAVRIEWTNVNTDIDVALIDMAGYELVHSADIVKITDTSALIIGEIQDPGMFIVYTTMNTLDGSIMPENYTLKIIGLDVLDEPTLTLSWYSRDSPVPTVFTEGDLLAGDHVIVNATWTDVDIAGLPEWTITSLEMKIFSGTLFYDEGPLVDAGDPGGVFSGVIDPSQFAWLTIPNLVAGDVARIVCDFDSSDVDVMMWPQSISLDYRTYANNIVDMCTGDHPETDQIILPEDGDYNVAILDYSGDGGQYYFTLDTRQGLEPARVYTNTFEFDTYYLMADQTYSILINSQTGTNIEHNVEIPNVFIKNFFAPEVTVNAPIPVVGHEERTFDVTWSSYDRNEDDENYYSLWLSNNGGASYMLIAQNLTTTTYRWNSSGWLTNIYMFRVRAYSLDFTDFGYEIGVLPDVSNPPEGYWPGDFGDGVSPEFYAGYNWPVDQILPTINSPVDIEYDHLSTGHSIIWTPYDASPFTYIIYLDADIVRSGAWNLTSETISISVDGLAVGLYNFTIVVSDTSGNSAIDTVLVQVVATITTTTTTTTIPTQEWFFTEIAIGIGLGVAAATIVIIILLRKRG